MSTHGLICMGGGGDHIITPLLEVSSSFGETLILLGLIGLIMIVLSIASRTASLALILVAILPRRADDIRRLFHHSEHPQPSSSADIKKPSAAPPKEPRKSS